MASIGCFLSDAGNNQHGRTALEWAREKGNERITKMLEDAQRKRDRTIGMGAAAETGEGQQY